MVRDLSKETKIHPISRETPTLSTDHAQREKERCLKDPKEKKRCSFVPFLLPVLTLPSTKIKIKDIIHHTIVYPVKDDTAKSLGKSRDACGLNVRF